MAFGTKKTTVATLSFNERVSNCCIAGGHQNY